MRSAVMRFGLTRFLAVLAAFVGGFLSGGNAFAQAPFAEPETIAPAEPKGAAAPELPPLPESNDPAVISAYLQKINEIQPAEKSREGFTALVGALAGRLDELLERPLEGKAAEEALGFRYAIFQISGQLSIPGTAEAKSEWLAKLAGDARPIYAVTGRGLSILADAQKPGAATGKEDVWKGLLERTVALLEETEGSGFAATVAMQISDMSQMAAPAALAAAAHTKFATLFAASSEETVRQAAPLLRGVANKLNLPGNEMIVTGKTPAGDDFTLDSLKGQVVVVDFWATWCGFCIEAFPELTTLYTKYHDDGLEIVGVNIDDNAKLWTDYLASNSLPWLHVQNLGTSEADRHPNADRYGINGIPFLVLIGRDGKVIRTDVAVDELKTLLPSALGQETP